MVSPCPGFDPDDAELLVALEGALTVQMNWAELIDVFERQIELATDEEAKREKMWALLELFELRLETDRTIRVCEDILEANSTDADALKYLKRLLTQRQRWYELVDLYPRLLRLMRSMQKQLSTRVGSIQMESLSDVEGATETLRRLFELMPHDLDTVLILDEMYRDTHPV